MPKIIEIITTPEVAFSDTLLKNYLLTHIKYSDKDKVEFRKLKQSIDARGRHIKVNLKLEVFINEDVNPLTEYRIPEKNVSDAEAVIIIGSGPAGLFAAIKCIESGYKPIILERGKDVRDRRRDLASINKENIVNPDSNYCFGEGGAGTYSDGKLYTRSTKRGDVRRILEILVAHGANERILYEAHPHIGTNKLPSIISAMRKTILDCGGEVHFNTRVTDFVIKDSQIEWVLDQHKNTFKGKYVILATGHSARDIFSLLNTKKILIEAKPFALGVRVEHNQDFIDQVQYKCETRGDLLPASSYSLVTQVGEGRGVYSFCMCPGGFIVPSATSQEEIVVNGMSPSKRDSRFANSGIVAAILPQDYEQYADKGALSALELQKNAEYQMWLAGGKTQVAPAQRLVDFVNNKMSSSLLDTSYQPGITSVNMNEALPNFVAQALRKAFNDFGQKMKGYLTNDAQIIGIESRTSSPVTIPRDKELLNHPQISNLYPCGEGAGYAGGIISAAIDGERVAEAIGKR